VSFAEFAVQTRRWLMRSWRAPSHTQRPVLACLVLTALQTHASGFVAVVVVFFHCLSSDYDKLQNKQTNKQTTTTKIKNKNKRRVGKRLNRDTERHRQMHSRSLCTHIHNAHRDRTHATHTHARTHAESIKMTECIKEKQLSRVSNFSPQFRTISKSPKTFLQSQMGESGLIRS